MKIASRFHRQPEPDAVEINLTIDGETATARAGDTLAAALLAWSGNPTRLTPVLNAPRTPWCMMGVCFDCLVEVDGKPNVQACMTQVSDGMVVRRQNGLRKLKAGCKDA